MTAPIEVARRELRRGRQPIPVPYRKKAPVLDGWQRLILTEADLPDYFNGRRQNVGILNGTPSGDQVDVDLDWGIARRLAPLYLPATASIFGRASSARAHWLYVADQLESTTAYDDPTGKHGDERARIAECRATGSQTVWPGSVHESGEAIEWAEDGKPAIVDGRELKAAVGKLAAASLLARHRPAVGSRHDASLALAGGLLRAAWPIENAEAFIEAVAAVAGDDEVENRVKSVATTDRAMRAGRQTTGWKTLAEIVDGRVITKVREWLGVPSTWTGDERAGAMTGQTGRPQAPWPTLDPDALHGLAGDVVLAILPTTEADPAALLVTFLALFGNAVGRNPHVMVGDDRHGINEFFGLVGRPRRPAKGRAGQGHSGS